MSLCCAVIHCNNLVVASTLRANNMYDLQRVFSSINFITRLKYLYPGHSRSPIIKRFGYYCDIKGHWEEYHLKTKIWFTSRFFIEITTFALNYRIIFNNDKNTDNQ